MRQDVPNLLLAGAVLASVEVAVTMLRGGGLFLSLGERLLYASTALSTFASGVLAIGLVLAAVTRPSRAAAVARVGCALGTGGVASTLLWLLTAGRRVHAAAWRLPVAIATAVLAMALAALVLALLRRIRQVPGAHAAPALAAVFLAAGTVAISALVLPRSYPAFHFGLALSGLTLAALAGSLRPVRFAPRYEARARWLALGCALFAPLANLRLAAHPTAGFAVREHAPWSSKLLPLFAPSRAPAAHARSEGAPARPAHQGVDLRDRDVLLITVDALRADLLRAYGGRGRTPELDRLADESAVFMRAYTPAPHTSYALASMLTGKFVKPLVELGGAIGDPPTVPDRLRRYGYRTAAFYPPAIFFVDGSSFGALAARGFGFEYRKEMFASAEERVGQLADYLAQAARERPLFAWVHLFEPHEPYAPPPGIAHDGSERGRYEAEVAACDRAVARLIATFRADRPGATVIVSADHGEEFGDHGGSFHGSSLYDEQVRVPLLWSSPGAVPSRRIDAPVELTDVGTTILSTAAIPRDAHMRGDDLGALLAGRDDAGPRFAFASIDGRHMVSDGRLKAICGAREPHCALFDSAADPGELRNLAGAQPERAAGLRRELDRFLASISRAEALTVSEGVGLPDALARAKLGAGAASDELIALLADTRAAVRAETARVLGELGVASAAEALWRVHLHDDDEVVRAEAAIASAFLGREAVISELTALLRAPATGEALARKRRAALALARFERGESVGVLSALALDEGATEGERMRAIRALGELGSELGLETLVQTLSAVRLREVTAAALGAVGGTRARDALVAQLQGERYPPARRAEAEALHKLGDPRAAALVRHFLGMESSLPGGVRLLAALGQLEPAGRGGALISDPRVRRGEWRCAEDACTPEAGAALVLPARGAPLQGAARVTVWVRHAEPGAALVIDGRRFPLATAEDQLSFERPAASATRFAFSREGNVAVGGLVVAPSVPELPPPAPEPWDGGVPDEAPSGPGAGVLAP